LVQGRLANASWVYLAVYAFVAFVAIVTSGADLIKDPLAYYAILVPLLFATFCLWTASHQVSARRLFRYGIVAHVLAAPAVFVSLLFLGVGLPILSYLWWRVYLRVKADEEATQSRKVRTTGNDWADNNKDLKT